MALAWTLLMCAIVFEVAGTTAMKLSAGFTKLAPSLMMFVFYAISFTLLTFSIKRLAISTAYTMWAGIGTALIAIIGVAYFREPISAIKIIGILLVILGIVLIHKNGGTLH